MTDLETQLAEARAEIARLKQLILNSDLTEANGTRVSMDDLQPKIVPAGRILVHKGYVDTVNQLTKDLLAHASTARQKAAVEKERDALKQQLEATTHERDQAVKESNRRDQKWMDGLDEIFGKNDWHCGLSAPDPDTPYRKWVNLKRQLEAMQDSYDCACKTEAEYKQQLTSAHEGAKQLATDLDQCARDRHEWAAKCEAMRAALEQLRKAHGHVASNGYDFDDEDRELLELGAAHSDLVLSITPSEALRQHDMEVAERAWLDARSPMGRGEEWDANDWLTSETRRALMERTDSLL